MCFLDENLEPLNWDLRIQIALDVARGLEYLHDGVSYETLFSCKIRVVMYAYDGCSHAYVISFS